MVKRKPEERMTLKDIMSHEWLTSPDAEQIIFEPVIIDPVNVPIIDPSDSNVISSLKKKIISLEQEISKMKANEKALA